MNTHKDTTLEPGIPSRISLDVLGYPNAGSGPACERSGLEVAFQQPFMIEVLGN